jgi:hypothetical protein
MPSSPSPGRIFNQLEDLLNASDDKLMEGLIPIIVEMDKEKIPALSDEAIAKGFVTYS